MLNECTTETRGKERERKKRAKQSYQGHRQLPGREKRRLERGYPETQREARGSQMLQKQQEREAEVEAEPHRGQELPGDS